MCLGLLHGIPEWERGSIEELLAECADETEPGGRIQAAQDLRDLLSDLLLDEEDEENEKQIQMGNDNDYDDYEEGEYEDEYEEDDGDSI